MTQDYDGYIINKIIGEKWRDVEKKTKATTKKNLQELARIIANQI